MTRALTSASCLLALAACVAACGHTALVGPNRTLHLALTEYRLGPQRVQAPAGELRILVRNNGRLTHNLAVSLNGHLEGSTPPISPGGVAELMLNLRRGTYLMASSMLSDQDLGLYGTLVVK
jgi:hypothetical protein